jgi:hypothetical protein
MFGEMDISFVDADAIVSRVATSHTDIINSPLVQFCRRLSPLPNCPIDIVDDCTPGLDCLYPFALVGMMMMVMLLRHWQVLSRMQIYR